MDFSERRPEEVMFLLTLSVLLAIIKFMEFTCDARDGFKVRSNKISIEHT